MFQYAYNINEIHCDLTSLIYTFECDDISVNNEIVTIIKVGKTSQTIKERLSSYTEINIKNIYWIQVENNDKVEKELLEYLKNLKLRLAKGREFFHTDIDTVKEAIINVISNSSIDENGETNNVGENQCEFCQKNFSANKNLVAHQKTARYCIKIQEEKINEKLEQEEKASQNKFEEFNCEFCKESFTLKSSLKRHLERCKDKNKTLVESMQVEVQNYVSKVKQLESTQFEKENSLNEYAMKIKILETIQAEKENSFKLLLAEKDDRIQNLTLERDNLLKQLFDFLNRS
jgi:hypothetical protein